MINIYFNGEKIAIKAAAFLSEILSEKGYVESGFAIAVNREFVPRSMYETFSVKQDDKIDVILPMQGG